MDVVQHNILVLAVDELIAKHSFAFVAPQSYSVEFWSNILHTFCFHDGLTTDLQDALEDT